jgi:hypothetical protein
MRATSISTSTVHVLVVESHQHVLEHTHHILRRKRLLNMSWSMLHFDAHPDLACPHPNIPAAACYNPRKTWPAVQVEQHESEEKSINSESSDDPNNEKDLYELLDGTSSGIAEWILPLVLAASLSDVRWIRPTGQLLKQFPLGEHQYNVGAWVPKQENPSSVLSFMDLPPSALVKVDRDCPYYQDDDTSVPCGELLLPKLLRLSVAELPEEQNPRVRDDERSRSPWMLDICLDYFACLNPFVTDIETLNPTFARALCDCVLKSMFYTEDRKDPSPRDQDALSTFRKLLSEELQRTACQDTSDVSKSSLQPLLKFYESPEIGEHLLTALLTSLRTSAAADRTQMATLAVEALPNLTMPHDSHQAVTMEAILPSVQVAQHEIELRQHEQAGTNPFIITIARSSVDGFTPECVVEELQAKVLTIIHTMYCNCQQGAPLTPNGQTDSCRMNLLFDYGEWEGSSFDF